MKFNINSSYVFFLINIFALFGLNSAHNCEFFKEKKDDCGNICGQINLNTGKTECEDPDKRNAPLIKFYEIAEKSEDETDYDIKRYLECVASCPAEYPIYKSTKFCVKNVAEFEAFEKECLGSDPESSNIWVIILSICGVAVAGAGGAFAYFKKKNSGKTRSDSPEVRASEVGLTKNNSV